MLPVCSPVIILVTEAASNLTHILWDCCAKNSYPLLTTAAEGTAADETHRHLVIVQFLVEADVHGTHLEGVFN